MEEDICETKALWQLAFEASEDGICDWNIVRNVVYFSDRWREMVGCQGIVLSRAFKEWEERIYPDDAAIVACEIESFHKGKTSAFRNKHRLLCHNDYRWMLCRGKVVSLDENRKPARIIYTFTDISEFEESMSVVTEALRQEKELNDLNTRIISLASHELRTPLSTILITTDALDAYLERMTREETRKKLKLIKKNLSFLKDMTEKMMDFAQIEAGKMVFSPVETEMNDYVEGIIADMREQYGYGNDVRLHKHDSSVLARIDRHMMKLSIINVISNAIKYSPAGSPVAVDLSCKGSNLLIHISDYGIGIPNEDAEHIFDPFHRGSNTRNIQGSGLGLFFVRKFVQHHGGNVFFISEAKKGTTFTVQLPCIANSHSQENPDSGED